MATDWAADVKKYAAKADDAVIAGIVRYCGIALSKPDSALVAFSDAKELARVRNNFLKKKLARTETDEVLDAAIAKVGTRMKADKTRNRVTVYYLLAQHFKALDTFAPKARAAAAVKPAPTKTMAPAKGESAPAAKKSAPAKKVAAAPEAAAPAKPKAAAPAKKARPAPKAAAPVKKAPATPKAAPPARKATAAPKKTAAPAKKAPATKTAPASATPIRAAAPVAEAASEPRSAPVAAAAAIAAPQPVISAPLATQVQDTPSATRAPPAAPEQGGIGMVWWVLGLVIVVFLAYWLFSGS